MATSRSDVDDDPRLAVTVHRTREQLRADGVRLAVVEPVVMHLDRAAVAGLHHEHVPLAVAGRTGTGNDPSEDVVLVVRRHEVGGGQLQRLDLR